MANYYVWNGGSGAGGTTWATAYTTIVGAITGKAAGDVFFVAHDHVETQATSMTITSVGTEANPCAIYCVNRAGSVPPVEADLRTTAQVTTTGTVSISVTGAFKEVYGIIFSVAGSLNINSTSTQRSARFVNCAFKLANVVTTTRINFGHGGGFASIDNCTVQFGEATTQGISPLGRVIIRNSPGVPFIQGAIIPVALFNTLASCNTIAEGLDLSNLTGSLARGSTSSMSELILKDCKLNASTTIMNGAISSAGVWNVILIRCDSGDTNYKTERHSYMGSQTSDATTYLTGGASDGTTPVSMKIVTTANTLTMPFECLPIHIWNDVVGVPRTVTMQLQWAGGTATNADIWMDVQYLGTSGFPLSLKATSGKSSTLGAGVNIGAGIGTWINPQATKHQMVATFTPQEKGPLTIYVKVARPSSTFWVDPKPVIT